MRLAQQTARHQSKDPSSSPRTPLLPRGRAVASAKRLGRFLLLARRRGLARGRRLTGDRRPGPTLLRTGLGAALQLLEAGAEFLQSALQVVHLVPECHRALSFRPAKEPGKIDRRLPARLLALPEPGFERLVGVPQG